MRRAAIERQAIALRSSSAPPEAVLDAVLPGVRSEPRLVRTRALEVGVEAAVTLPDGARCLVTSLREALESGPPLSTHEIELLLPIALERPRALADCLQPLFDVLAEGDGDSPSLLDDDGINRRQVAAATVLVAAVDRAPGLFQGAVPMLVEWAGTETVVERRCLWAIARGWDAEPAIVRPAIASAVWTIEDECGEKRRRALDRLSTIGRICPDSLPSKAVSIVASAAADGQPKNRAHAFYTLAAIGGRPSDALRRHALNFDDIDDHFLENQPALTDRLLGEEPAAPGQAAPESVAAHRAVIIDALEAEDTAVARAAQDAAIVLGRESPTWIRSHIDAIQALIDSDSPVDREAAASLIQRTIPDASKRTLKRAFTWLRRLLGDEEVLVCQRTVATLGTLLSELIEAEPSTEPEWVSAMDVWCTLIGRYLTGSGDVREVIAGTVETIELDRLPPGALEAASSGLLSRTDRMGAGGALPGSDDGLDVVRGADENHSVDRGIFIELLDFAARLLDKSGRTDDRLAKAIVAYLETAESDLEDLFDTLVMAESSLRHASVSGSEIIETAYWSPDTYGVDDLRQEVLNAAPSLERIDPSVIAAIVEDATIDIIDRDTPYWTEAAAVQAIEDILLSHPRVSECVRDELLDTIRAADDEQRVIVARLAATAFLAAPPRDSSEIEDIATILESTHDEPEVEAWLAATLLVFSPDETIQSQSTERIRSLRVRADLNMFGAILEVVCVTTGALPSPLIDPLATREPALVFDALSRLGDAPDISQRTLEAILERIPLAADPAARAGLGSVLSRVQVSICSNFSSALRQERLLWFLTGDTLRTALESMSVEQSGDSSHTSRIEADAGYRSAFSALTVHPDGEVRDLAARLTKSDTHDPNLAGLQLLSAYRVEPPSIGVESDEESTLDERDAPGQTSSVDQQTKLVRAVRHGDPKTTLEGLKAIQRGIDQDINDWEEIESVVVDHLTDRWRIIRRAAAHVLLRATWADKAEPDPSFLADRLVTDEATTGVLTQILVALDPDQWPAPSRTTPVFLDYLLSEEPYSERHAAGQALGTLARTSPDVIGETITDGVERLADGEGDALAAYHLLAAFDRLVSQHGFLADDITGYLETILTSDSFAGIPSRDDGRTKGPVSPDVAPSVDRLSVYEIAASLAAHGGFRAYRGVLDPPDPLTTQELLTGDGVKSFLRNASDDAIQDIAPSILQSLSQAELTEILDDWVGTDDNRSPALAARRIDVVPLLAGAADELMINETTERPRYVDTVVEALTAEDSEVRVAAVEALSQLCELNQCPSDELTAHLLDCTADPSGWVRRSAVEVLAEHAPTGELTGDWLHHWAKRELTQPRGLRSRSASMLLGALGTKEPRLRRECLETAADAFPSGRQQLNDRLASSIRRLTEHSPVLKDTLDDEVLDRLDERVS